MPNACALLSRWAEAKMNTVAGGLPDLGVGALCFYSPRVLYTLLRRDSDWG